ncbi:MAG: UDP-N-acetylmuramate--L-alanine ligase [Ruminococcus sp.]|nr:UDP-N-acetylmuramate--L-alanine ligase [Ruminococcus sp.]
MISDEILKSAKHIHFIGIGGSGMYPLVQILHSEGYYITGSDNNETETLDAVRKMGIEVCLGQRAENIGDADLIVYTAAIMPDNPELIAAKASSAVCAERAEMLGLLTSHYSNAVCVCGTHGKTTATSMITQIMLESGKDISCFIGGKLPLIGGSGRAGSSDTMVCEACEFEDHFLKLYPDVAVILNVDADHLDYFGTIENVIKSFRRFAEMTTDTLIINGGDANTLKAVEGLDKPVITFGFGRDNDYSAVITSKKGLRTDFELYRKGEPSGTFTINVPGDHNVLNALAAIAASEHSGVPEEGIRKGLESFTGALRRFQKIAEVGGVTIVDDYAHHPAELAATLTAAKSLDFKRVWAVFQPFTYTRTSLLLDDFVKALSIADIAVITDIMGSREKNTVGIYTEDLASKIEGAVWFETDHALADRQTAEQKNFNFKQCVDYIAEHCEPGDLVITLGCGDAYKAAKMLAGRLGGK